LHAWLGFVWAILASPLGISTSIGKTRVARLAGAANDWVDATERGREREIIPSNSG
jgi:hypothetical protein